MQKPVYESRQLTLPWTVADEPDRIHKRYRDRGEVLAAYGQHNDRVTKDCSAEKWAYRTINN